MNKSMKLYKVYFRNERSADGQLQSEVIHAENTQAARKIYEDCGLYVASLYEIDSDEMKKYDAMPVIEVAAWVAMADDDERPAPLVTGRENCPAECPVTDPQQVEDEIKMREDLAADQWADGRREYRFGKSL